MPNSAAGLRVPGRLESGRQLARAVSLLSLLVLTPGCDQFSGGVVAEALFQVSAVPPALISSNQTRFDAREYAIFQKSQVALLKSFFVMNSAVRDPGIMTLPILANRDDQVAWLQENVEVDFLDGSEILSIRLRGTRSEADDLRRLVDAVSKAYTKEVVYNEKQRRLVIRDAKAKVAAGLGKDVSTGLEQFDALSKELGETSSTSPDLQLRQIELEVLEDTYRKMRISVESDDIEMGAPSRIRQIQPAVVSPD